MNIFLFIIRVWSVIQSNCAARSAVAMGQKPCVCQEDCQIRPWNLDNSVVTTLSDLDKATSSATPALEKRSASKGERSGCHYFDVELSKHGNELSFGMAHVPMEDGSGHLLVVDFRDVGPVARWNEQQRQLGKEDSILRRGDRIVSVGPVTDLDGIKAKLRQASIVFNAVRWPQSIAVRLTKGRLSDQFGVQLETVDSATGLQILRVNRITAGILSEWNNMAWRSRRLFEIVSPGFEIISVNGVECPAASAQGLQQLFQERDDVEVVFRRPSPEWYTK